MSAQFIRILIAGALFVHGVGHTLGYFRPARSLFFLKAPEPALRIAGGVFWTAAVVGFVLSALGFGGLLVPAGWWRSLSIGAALISLVRLVLFGRDRPTFNFIGAVAMNIAVLIALLWLHWPPFEMFNR